MTLSDLEKIFNEINYKLSYIETVLKDNNYFKSLKEQINDLQNKNDDLLKQLNLKNDLLDMIIRYLRSYQVNITYKDKRTIKVELIDNDYLNLLEMLNVNVDKEKQFIKKH